MKKVDADIRRSDRPDIQEAAAACEAIDWNNPSLQFERYWIEQLDLRDMLIARVKDRFAGYLTICWGSGYAPFREKKIPEIMEFSVLPGFRSQGVGTRLVDRAEMEIAKVSPVAGIGVGMTPEYGAAQRLYVLRGYVPDGRGPVYKGHPIRPGEPIAADDNLVLHLTKELA